ncbi:hypothetical protein V2G26_017384 [Clonostachys chloroleuca]
MSNGANQPEAMSSRTFPTLGNLPVILPLQPAEIGRTCRVFAKHPRLVDRPSSLPGRLSRRANLISPILTAFNDFISPTVIRQLLSSATNILSVNLGSQPANPMSKHSGLIKQYAHFYYI